LAQRKKQNFLLLYLTAQNRVVVQQGPKVCSLRPKGQDVMAKGLDRLGSWGGGSELFPPVRRSLGSVVLGTEKGLS